MRNERLSMRALLTNMIPRLSRAAQTLPPNRFVAFRMISAASCKKSGGVLRGWGYGCMEVWRSGALQACSIRVDVEAWRYRARGACCGRVGVEERSLGGALQVDARALEARYTCVDVEFASRVLELWRYPADVQTWEVWS